MKSKILKRLLPLASAVFIFASPITALAAQEQLTPEMQAAIIAQQQAAALAAQQAQAAIAIQQAQQAALAAQQAQAAAGQEQDGTNLQAGLILAGTCTTSLSGSSSNRINNIKVASGRLNNVILAPGQALSVSTAILPRTAENGYKMAGVYSGGKTVQGIGGGICQVSSTTYNAVMNAGLLVTSRYPHSMPVHYLPLGQDAAISAGSKDMVFVNNYSTPIILQTSCSNSSLTVSVYADAATLAGRTYKFYAKNTGSLSAQSYRDTYLNGVLVGTELVASSHYSAHNGD